VKLGDKYCFFPIVDVDDGAFVVVAVEVVVDYDY
jgi:hypothetical protein